MTVPAHLPDLNRVKKTGPWVKLFLSCLHLSCMNRLSKTFFLIILSHVATAQIVLTGKVIHATSNEPVSYANIGITNTSIGTLSNLDGSFFIIIPAKNENDSLTFSALGFATKAMAIRKLTDRQDFAISLEEKAVVLNSVEITNRKEKNKTFEVGNSQVRGGVLETDTVYAGGSVALLIDSRSEKELQFPVYLQQARLRILKNNLPSMKFRVRVNEVDASGTPGKDLLHQSMVMESTMRKGWLDFDFSHLGFVVDKPFFITFEQILDVHDRTRIADGYREFMEKHPDKLEIDTVIFEGQKQVRKMIKGSGIDLPGTFVAISPAQAENFTCYERDNSLGSWTKVRGIVTATVTLSNQRVLKQSRQK